MAALAVAVPAAGASAVTPAPAVGAPFVVGFGAFFAPGSFPCQVLIGQVEAAYLTGNLAFASVLSNAFIYSGCGGAAI
jgi:hypothetical protein